MSIVTGAGSGIGAATARVLAGAGSYVVCLDIDALRAEKTASQITTDGAMASSLQVDVSDRQSVNAAVEKVFNRHGRLNVMCNIAGIITEADAIDLSESDFDRTLNVNLKGTLFGSQSAARVMTSGASIINMASLIVDKPSERRMAYAVSKAGVIQLTRGFALEFGKRGIRVNAVAPGWVLSAMTSRSFTDNEGGIDDAARSSVLATRAAASPLGVVGYPVDIGLAVLYLASDAARFCTGQVLRPNGGAVMV